MKKKNKRKKFLGDEWGLGQKKKWAAVQVKPSAVPKLKKPPGNELLTREEQKTRAKGKKKKQEEGKSGTTNHHNLRKRRNRNQDNTGWKRKIKNREKRKSNKI